jgi:hypothetical protein
MRSCTWEAGKGEIEAAEAEGTQHAALAAYKRHLRRAHQERALTQPPAAAECISARDCRTTREGKGGIVEV